MRDVDSEKIGFRQRLNKRSFFIVRVIIAAAILFLALAVSMIFKKIMEEIGILDLVYIRIVWAIIIIVMAYLGYRFYLHFIEQRKPVEYSSRGWFKELTLGMAIGAGLISLPVLILWLAGNYQIDGITFQEGIIKILLLSAVAGFVEELSSRGIIFRLFEEGVGSWLAVLISAAFFGGMHIPNTGGSIFSSFAVAVEFGLILALFFMITRRLWLVTGYHFAWNFTLGGIWGINVSGEEVEGLFQSQLDGPIILTGGAFGLEASIIPVAICLVISIALAIYAIKHKCVIEPMWRKE